MTTAAAASKTTTTTKTVAAHLAAVAAVSALAALEAEINAAFPERAGVVRALLTAAVAGEHTVMLGPPGTAKSALARALKSAFSASYFELLMTRFTTPEEVFGPVKLSALQQDRFARAMTSYLPCAEVVFLDEIFKANSAILNALLTALNERTFHDDGKPVAIPLMTCIAASNELPEGPELDALYDRFLVRCTTHYIADRDAFRDLIGDVASGKRGAIATKVDIRAEQAAAALVTLTPATLDAIGLLRDACIKGGVTVSDRRWVQCLGLIRAAAHIDGRTATEPEDIEVLEHVLWRKQDERAAITRLVLSTANPDGAKATADLDAARDLVSRLPDPTATAPGVYMAAMGTATQDLADILDRVAKLAPGRKVDLARTEIAAMKLDVGKRAMRAAGIRL